MIRFNAFLGDLKYTHLHNSYLNHLVAGGLFGLLIFLLLLLLPVILIYYQDCNESNVLFAYLIISHNLSSGLTNLYFRHDLLSSFNAILPLVLLLSIFGDKKLESKSL